MAGLDQLVERARAGRDDADVDALADRPADHLHFAAVDEFDQFRLGFQRDALDMVDDDAAAVGLDQPPDLAVEGARKGAALVPDSPDPISPGDTAEQSTMTSAPRARGEAPWTARAKTSLPVPGLPLIIPGTRARAASAAIQTE